MAVPNKFKTLLVALWIVLFLDDPSYAQHGRLGEGGFVGNVHEFTGVGRAMLVSPGKHRIKIALPGYQTFETEITLLPKQKFKIETELAKGSITQADPLMRKE